MEAGRAGIFGRASASGLLMGLKGAEEVNEFKGQCWLC